MQKLIVEKSSLSGSISIPPSKSQTMRALLFAALAKGTSRIYNVLISKDTELMIEGCRALGAEIHSRNEYIEITGVAGKPLINNAKIDVGNSGIALRFLTAAVALGDKAIVVSGDHSIQTMRSVAPLVDALRQLGAKVEYLGLDGFAPIRVCGPIRPGSVTVEGQDSQPVSALLIALAQFEQQSKVTVLNAGEIPWVELTLCWLRKHGVKIEDGYQVVGKVFDAFEYFVPADLSTLSFPLAAALMTNSKLTIHGLDLNDPQGDKALIALLQKMGAVIDIESSALHISKSTLKGQIIDVDAMIDTVCVLTAIGSKASGVTAITNAEQSRGKECDRLKCSVLEFKKLGADVTLIKGGIEVSGGALKGAKVYSHKDHRLALALAISGLAADGVTEVYDTECIAKTYPTFVEDFQRIGAKIRCHQIPSDASLDVLLGESHTVNV